MTKKVLLTLPLFGSLIFTHTDLKADEMSKKMYLTFGGISKYVKYEDKKKETSGGLSGAEVILGMPVRGFMVSTSFQVAGGDLEKGKLFSSKDTEYRVEAGVYTVPYHYLNFGLGLGLVSKDYDSISRKMKAYYPWLSGSTFFEVGPFILGPQLKIRIEKGKVDKIDSSYNWKTGYEIGVLISDKKDKGIGNLMLYPFYLKDKTNSSVDKQAGVSIRFNF